MKRPSILILLLAALAVDALALRESCADAQAVQFNRDIRPILSDKCFACHGQDGNKRQADLRLDDRSDAVADRGGYAAIVPGDAEASAVMTRVLTDDPDERMPPAATNKRLTEKEVELLRAWIVQGAAYQKHWALEPLRKPPVPAAEGTSLRNPIDAFVAQSLREHGMRPAPEASWETLHRRVSLDLTGLPPTPAEQEAFRADLARPGANGDECYERVVDRLLASPHFGEHLAADWLDAARFADTNGYFSDKPRQMWLWRDWVIDAFNANQPFDRFTIEQLAGDLLPKATVAQRIATGFNRNHMANNETGIIDEEFRTEYVVDRVNTTMSTWLGLTAGCAQCHDHKFDPISQREFYQLFAFFNNVPETGLIHTDNPPPLIYAPSAQQERRLGELEAESCAAAEAFERLREPLAAAIAKWEMSVPPVQQSDDLSAIFLAENTTDRASKIATALHENFDGRLGAGARSLGTTLNYERGMLGDAAKFDATQHVETAAEGFDPDAPWTIGFWFNPDGSLSCPLSLIEPTADRRGLEMIWGKGILTVHLVNCWGVSAIEVATIEPVSPKGWHHIAVSYDGSRFSSGLRVFLDGSPAKVEGRRDTLSGTIANAEPLRIGRRDSGLGCYGLIDELRIVPDILNEATVSAWYWGERIRGILAVPVADRREADAETLLDYFVERYASPEALAARQRAKSAKRAEHELRSSIPSVLVMQEQDQPRKTHVLQRGQYDQRGEVVQPGVPAAIAPWPESAPLNRLGFAQWLVSAENPLTPRVAANRLWRQCFGEGLVRTVDDFGSQGEPPTHPELLDWLAATFREDGCDVKRLLKRIVTSRTYRQASHFAPSEADIADPQNRLLARGPSHRLSAEMLRDQALALSGLLANRIGGPSVKPYQPPGLWEGVSYNAEESYVSDAGEGLWRRSVYTYIKRQSPPPMLLTFDGPTREKCVLRRERTNTPLQALYLLNEETFVEAAQALAARALTAPGDDSSRLERLCRTVLLRDAGQDELELLRSLLDGQRRRFASDPNAAGRLVSVGASDFGRSLDACELAAWTMVAHTVLNLDETLTKP